MKPKQLSLYVIIFAIVIVILADTDNFPYLIWKIYSFPFGDKLGHLFLLGLLSYVLNWNAIDSRPVPEHAAAIWRVSLILGVVATLEEISQQFFPDRTLSLLDVTFSYLGILLGVYLLWRTKLQYLPNSE